MCFRELKAEERGEMDLHLDSTDEMCQSPSCDRERLVCPEAHDRGFSDRLERNSFTRSIELRAKVLSQSSSSTPTLQSN